jgi:hypothetical protein
MASNLVMNYVVKNLLRSISQVHDIIWGAMSDGNCVQTSRPGVPLQFYNLVKSVQGTSDELNIVLSVKV